jgi:hypothetical protein
MSDDNREADVDVNKEWRATHCQKSAATRPHFAVIWIVIAPDRWYRPARQHKFDHGNLRY